MLVRELAEARSSPRVKLEPNGRLKAFVYIGPDLFKVLAGDLPSRSVQDAKNPDFRSPLSDLFFANDDVRGSRIIHVTPADLAGVVLDPVRSDRLQAVRLILIQEQGVGRVPADLDGFRFLIPIDILPGQNNVRSRVQVFLPLLPQVRDRISIEPRVSPGRYFADPRPFILGRRPGEPVLPKRLVNRAAIPLVVGEYPELERAHVRQHLLDVFNFLVARLRQYDLDPVPPHVPNRYLLHPFRIGSLLQRRNELFHVHASISVVADHFIDQDRSSREVDSQLQTLLGRPHEVQPSQGGADDHGNLPHEALHRLFSEPSHRSGAFPCDRFPALFPDYVFARCRLVV